MKRRTTQWLFLLIAVLFFFSGLAIDAAKWQIKTFHYMAYALAGIAILFCSFLIFRKLNSKRSGLTPGDELNTKIVIKAAAYAFAASIYLWAILLFGSIQNKTDNTVLLGIGIFCMALLFLGFWVYQYQKDMVDEK